MIHYPQCIDRYTILGGKKKMRRMYSPKLRCKDICPEIKHYSSHIIKISIMKYKKRSVRKRTKEKDRNGDLQYLHGVVLMFFVVSSTLK
jgi:hypothetical protein